MKQLKKDRIVSHYYNHLNDNELKLIFQHKDITSDTLQGLLYQVFIWCCLLFQLQSGEHYKLLIFQFVFLPNSGINFFKYSQKNDQGEVNRNFDALMIPVPSDPEG
ncbi:10780_t:CDS:1 [Cetraspora pellucida]|uniref:10780_t:CDS:1 n=1 Tax=Cetraspora pellucida TaxID=1433469 RepID=A0ACA9NW33_9GLOM|nr:10780_t:CDS:1 [Cetraspora pellucida]